MSNTVQAASSTPTLDLALAELVAAEINAQVPVNLSFVVSPRDEMLDSRAPDAYLRCGASALKAIQLCLQLSEHASAGKILDFGCGHGRVMRWIRAKFPDAELTGTDVAEDGVNFCSNSFGSKAIVSGYDFENLPDYGSNNLIWAGSVFTHLTENSARLLLQNFISWLAPNGVAVFSTHGRSMETRLLEHKLDYMMGGTPIPLVSGYYGRSGYGYSQYPSTPEYGISMVSPDWYWNEIRGRRDVRLVMYSERAWDYHHDIVAIQKVPI